MGSWSVGMDCLRSLRLKVFDVQSWVDTDRSYAYSNDFKLNYTNMSWSFGD